MLTCILCGQIHHSFLLFATHSSTQRAYDRQHSNNQLPESMSDAKAASKMMYDEGKLLAHESTLELLYH